MSLTSIIKIDKNFGNYIRTYIPKKGDFIEKFNKIPFSGELLVDIPKSAVNKNGIIGTAFDYCARIILLKYTNGSLDDFLKDSIWYDSFLEIKTLQSESKSFQSVEQLDNYRKLDEYVKKIEEDLHCFWKQDSLLECEDILDAIIYMVGFENLYRGGFLLLLTSYYHGITYDIIEQYFDYSAKEEIKKQIKELVKLFYSVFIQSGLVSEKSDIVYNPKFGKIGSCFGGADADIFIDGVLYDFKCTRHRGYMWKDVAQIYSYFIMNAYNQITELDSTASLYNKTIKSIALYHARTGCIEQFDITNQPKERLIETMIEFEKILSLINDNLDNNYMVDNIEKLCMDWVNKTYKEPFILKKEITKKIGKHDEKRCRVLLKYLNKEREDIYTINIIPVPKAINYYQYCGAVYDVISYVESFCVSDIDSYEKVHYNESVFYIKEITEKTLKI